MFKQIALAATVAAAFGTAQDANAEASDNLDHDYRVIAKASHVHAHSKKHTKHHAKAHTTHHVVERDIHRRVKNGVLPVLKLTGLKKGFEGYNVEAVIVKVRPARSYGRVRLVVNGQVVDGERVNGERVIRLHPDSKAVVGRNLHTLRLDVRGKVYIEDLKVRVSKKNKIAKKRHHHDHWTHIENMDERTARRIARIILKRIDSSRFEF